MPTRRHFLATAAGAALARPLAAAPPAPPNVVFILGDDQGWRDYGFMGHPRVATPRLDKLAAESLRFPRGYVPSSLCRASLASAVTGLYPHQHGITSNDPPDVPQGKNSPQYRALRAAMVARFERSPSLPKLLGAAGYSSFQAGKWWEGDACRCGGFTAGMSHGDPARGGRHGDDGLTVGRAGVGAVEAFLDGAGKSPFFVWYAPMMPHQPHNPPARLAAKYAPHTPSAHVAKYWAMCEWFDETVGAVLDALEKRGAAQNTLVVYLHDNGWIQEPDKPAYAAKSKRSPYDGGLRTPILVRWPGKVAPAEVPTPVSSLDVAPTVLAAAGLKPTADMPGVNLLDAAAVAGRGAVFGEIFEHTAVSLDDPAANLMYRWVVAGGWKLIVPEPARVPGASAELYDLSADPDEARDLASRHPGRVAELRARLDGWWKGRG